MSRSPISRQSFTRLAFERLRESERLTISLSDDAAASMG
jgi:hypothetical protein